VEKVAVSKHLGEFEQLLMFSLLELEADAHGVTIRQAIADRTGRQVSPGAVYTALERLESRGLVSSRIGDTAPARGGRRRKYYELKPEGAEILKRSYDMLTGMAEGLLSKLSSVASAEGR
jgi:DNA-binding PadR family transcriptional regulator